MIKERILEIFEFTQSESPYRKANKGWINQDIFLDLSASPDLNAQRKEAAKITLLWSPINKLISNIFLVFLIGVLLVFISLNFVNGHFNFNLFNTSLINGSVKLDENEDLSLNQISSSKSINTKVKGNSVIKENYKTIDPNSLADVQVNLEKTKIDKKVDKQVNSKKDIEVRKDMNNLKNNKSKSNFI